jgi:hypothetical protein
MTGDAVRWLVLVLVLSGAAGGLYYKYEITRPCATPIHYAIGAVDSQFDLTPASLEKAAASATQIWGTAEGKSLFVYDPTAALKVNLIYDSREAAAKQGQSIASEKVRLDASLATITIDRAQCVAVSDPFARQSCSQSLNNEIGLYNSEISSFNADVSAYNKTAGHTFEEGQFVRDASGERINIFEFVGSDQLTRVLAHEFGHALGLEHNDDPASIMYAENESGNLTPSAADLAALQALCGS